MDHEVKTSVNAHLILTGRGIFSPIFELNDNNFMDFTVSFMLLWGFLGIFGDFMGIYGDFWGFIGILGDFGD